MGSYKESPPGVTRSSAVFLASSNDRLQGWIPSATSSSGAVFRSGAPIADQGMVDGHSLETITHSMRTGSRLQPAADSPHSHSARVPPFNSPHSFRDVVLSSTKSSRATVTTNQPIDDNEIGFHGEWSFVNDPHGFNASYHISTHNGDQAILRFTGSGIAVSGFTNSTSGPFNTTLDGQDTILDGHSSLAQATVLFFQTGLDPSKEHSLTITNAADSLLAIGTIDVTTISGGTSSHSLSRGVIAGIAVVSVLSVLLLLTLVFLIVVRRRRGGSGLPFKHVKINLGRLFSRSRPAPDNESVFDGEPITFKTYEKGRPVENWSPAVPLPRPPREYAPGGQRVSVTWRDSLANQSDTYTLPNPRASDRRRGSRTLLLSDMLDTTSYLSFGRSGQPPPNGHVSVLPQIVTEEVIDIRAPTPAQAPSHAADQSFLDITSSSSPSSKHQSFPSSSSSRNANRGSHQSKRASRSQRASGSSGLGNSVLRSLFPRSLQVAPAASSGSSSFPYPFVGEGQHVSALDISPPSPGGSVPQSVSDIHFRAVDDFTETEGALTRPGSMPAPPRAGIEGLPNGSPVIVQRFLGMWRQPPSVDANAPDLACPPYSAPAFQPQPWPLSPVSPRTNGPAGPRPPSIVRR